MDKGSKANISVALSLKPQARKVLRHLELHGYITPMIALNTYGFYRLAASVHEIRKRDIRVETELREDAVGHRYAYYTLANAA
jgi:hypothetical protein